MANVNDGRIPGGPTTELIMNQRTNHISDKIFTGESFDHDPLLRLREHGNWRKERLYDTWVLNDVQKALVQSFGFQYLDQIKFLIHDRDLILSLAERWWPERNTFQLPIGEMTITLCDVANILGLPIIGDPIYFDQQSTSSNLITTYLGVMPPDDLKGSSFVTFSWLRGNFMDLNHTMDDEEVVVDNIRIIQCTRAYLLALCGAILFPDSNGNTVNVRLLPFLADLTKPTSHAWGAATLAYLYAMLTEFATMKTRKSICGCMSLVQVWSYEHFYIGRPVTSVTSDIGVFPVSMRWSTDVVDQQHCQYKAVSIYREQFDTLQYTEVIWAPYTITPNDPEIKGLSYWLSMHRSYIIYDRYTMYHPGDRVLRQFGRRQIIPDDPPTISYAPSNARSRIITTIVKWNRRFEHYSVRDISPLIQSPNDYMGDYIYRKWWGSPRMVNRNYDYEEPRFKCRAIDDSSLRAFVDGIHDLSVQYQQSFQQPETLECLRHSRGLMQELVARIDRLGLGRDPEMPPIQSYLPTDYPRGVVRRRHSRRRRDAAGEDEAAQQEEDEELPGEQAAQYAAGEEAAQYYPGEEAGQYYPGESSQYYPGEGSTQYYPGESSQYYTPSAPVPTQTQAAAETEDNQEEEEEEEEEEVRREDTAGRRRSISLSSVARQAYRRITRRSR
ncbi:uncharacterized protein M6B38_148280 [Iris pallida]|uniref:Aminotransferase-like plant mobile domain-containing protein n=1 Tax=Iris pallida TaxID=29817 RepID=A0AAX6F9I7_IRIPA|nr:uncharacterized protein M6B38_148280 [Iris pallida]